MAAYSTRSINPISDHGFYFQKTQQPAGLRIGAGLHRFVSQPDCPDPAGRDVSEGFIAQLAAVLAHRCLSACCGLLSPDLWSVLDRRSGQSGVWSPGGVGAGTLQLSRQTSVRLAGGSTVRPSDSGCRYCPDNDLRAQRVAGPAAGLPGNQVCLLPVWEWRSRSPSSGCLSWSEVCNRSSRTWTKNSRKQRRVWEPAAGRLFPG